MGVHKTSPISVGVHGAWESMGTHHQPPWESIKPRTAGVGSSGGGRLNRDDGGGGGGGGYYSGCCRWGHCHTLSTLICFGSGLGLALGLGGGGGVASERARVWCVPSTLHPRPDSAQMCESDTGDGSKLDVRAKLDGFNLPKPGWGCMKCGGQGACRKRLGGTGNAIHGEPKRIQSKFQNLQPQRSLQEWLENC